MKPALNTRTLDRLLLACQLLSRQLMEERESKKFSQEWWAARGGRLRSWVMSLPVAHEKRREFFSIVANGTATMDEHPILQQQHQSLKWEHAKVCKERDALLKERDALTTHHAAAQEECPQQHGHTPLFPCAHPNCARSVAGEYLVIPIRGGETVSFRRVLRHVGNTEFWFWEPEPRLDGKEGKKP